MAKKNSQKGWLVMVLVVLLVLAAGAAGWSLRPTKGIEQSNELAQAKRTNATSSTANVKVAPIEVRRGTIETPDYLKAEELDIVSLGETATITPEGDFSAPVYKDGTTAVFAMLPEQEFGLVNMVIGEADPEITLESTAAALVFMAPYLMSSDPDLAAEIMAVIEAEPATTAFATELDRVLREGDDPFADDAAVAAYGAAIEAVIATLSASE